MRGARCRTPVRAESRAGFDQDRVCAATVGRSKNVDRCATGRSAPATSSPSLDLQANDAQASNHRQASWPPATEFAAASALLELFARNRLAAARDCWRCSLFALAG